MEPGGTSPESDEPAETHTGPQQGPFLTVTHKVRA
jgi:hypothetical protein